MKGKNGGWTRQRLWRQCGYRHLVAIGAILFWLYKPSGILFGTLGSDSRLMHLSYFDLQMYDHETPLHIMEASVTTPFGIRLLDQYKHVNRNCPRYVTMEKAPNGLGHQLGTYTTALITSLFFDLTFVDSAFIDETAHGMYAGIASFTGLQEGELLLGNVEKLVDRIISVEAMPVFPTTENLTLLYEPLRHAFWDTYKDQCNVLFKIKEYYSYDYGTYTRPILARKFANAPYRNPISVLYSPNEFNIAVHVRTGDINPTSESFFVCVLSQVLPLVSDVPFRIHVFAEGKGADEYPLLKSLAPSDRLIFHPNLPAFESFYHLTQAQVLVMSASGFSQFAAIVATKPLVFCPPSREPFPLKFCPPDAVCCAADGSIDPQGLARAERRKRKWLVIQKWKLNKL